MYFDSHAHLGEDCFAQDFVHIVENIRTAGVSGMMEIGFDGPMRPDHGRMIWDEVDKPGVVPGYGLYDRALGATYLQGLWEAIDKAETRKEFAK